MSQWYLVGRVVERALSGPLGATVPGDVSGPSARRAHDAVGDVGLVGTQPGLVVGGGAVGTTHGVVLPQRAVELRQLPELHPPQVVLSLGHLHPLTDHLLNLHTTTPRRCNVNAPD